MKEGNSSLAILGIDQEDEITPQISMCCTSILKHSELSNIVCGILMTRITKVLSSQYRNCQNQSISGTLSTNHIWGFERQKFNSFS